MDASRSSWLDERGVTPSQIALLPSHDGEPGAQGAGAVRARYRSLRRSFVPLEQVFPRSALPTATDNKLDAHEWLLLRDGIFSKCDAESQQSVCL